jgi:hypothetical protein
LDKQNLVLEILRCIGSAKSLWVLHTSSNQRFPNARPFLFDYHRPWIKLQCLQELFCVRSRYIRLSTVQCRRSGFQHAPCRMYESRYLHCQTSLFLRYLVAVDLYVRCVDGFPVSESSTNVSILEHYCCACPFHSLLSLVMGVSQRELHHI